MSVHVHASATLKRWWEKAQRTSENLISWQPWTDYS